MRGTEGKKASKHICTGILAHVDAGKTTLSEAMLYVSGNIRRAGRVDNGDAFLDTYAMERARGITIFSKQAELKLPGAGLTLLDTPGHVDFSAEMERVLQVLDYAILVISGADGVQEHTRTLWKLLARYRIPVFLFVNKMDQNGTDKGKLLAELQRVLHENCIDFSDCTADSFFESVAMCDEKALETYLQEGTIAVSAIAAWIAERKLFPCFFGSALKLDGVAEFLTALVTYTKAPAYAKAFGAKVFKIARDEQGMRLTYLKVTGGTLSVKQMLTGIKKGGAVGEKEQLWEEKVNQIRIYSGEKYETADAVEAGRVCAVTGLSYTYPGAGLGAEQASGMPVLEPVLTYRVLLPDGTDAAALLPKLRLLEEEEPELYLTWNEHLREILVQVMGEVQIEVLKSLIQERFGIAVELDEGHVVYKETIANVVEGVGHFEPLRHYAEVHLRMEPAEPGSGLIFAAECSEDVLEKNWQRLILTHLKEREHIGVCTGSAITDMRITLVSGKAHSKHTEGGDFRQAVYRAVRQGLMQADTVLLEPYYDFVLEVPEDAVGRAMTDIERMCGTINYDAGWESHVQETEHMEGMRRLTGSVPVAAIQNYQKELISYTRGKGRLTVTHKGYLPCHNTQEVIAAVGYEPERDLEHTPDSVFCAHGAGFIVPWNHVAEYMHLPSALTKNGRGAEEFSPEKCLPEARETHAHEEEAWIGTEEIDRILARTYNANKKETAAAVSNRYKRRGRARETVPAVTREYRTRPAAEEYLLVDGYNILFAWEELAELAQKNMDSARGKLLDILCDYQGIRRCHLMVVFDAYRVQGHKTEILAYHNIQVVYTKEAETADAYIEKFAHEHGKNYRVTVATSDGLEQIIIRGAGCALLSAREFAEEIARAHAQMMDAYQETREKDRQYLLDGVSEEVLHALRREDDV